MMLHHLCLSFRTLQSWGVGLWMNYLYEGSKKQASDALVVYLCFVGGVFLTTISRSLMEAVFSCNGAQCLHDIATVRVIQAPCSWFDSTPIGRIVNRFSQDITTIVSI